MIRFLLLLTASFALVACGPHPASPGDKPAVSVVDTALVEATRALILAEAAYEPVAASALALIRAGKITGTTAATVRDVNRAALTAFRAAKATKTGAQMAVEVARMKSATATLAALIAPFK